MIARAPVVVIGAAVLAIGRSWRLVPAVDDSGAVQGGGVVVTAVMVTGQRGFAVVTGDAFWITHDGGRTWSAVTVNRD